MMLICVIVSLCSAMLISLVSAAELIHVGHLGWIFIWDTSNASAKVDFVLSIIELVDITLLAGIAFIFSFGLYELYIDKLDPANGSEASDRLLNITSIDKLKKKLGHLILMLFVIKLFSYFVKIKVTTAQEFLMVSCSVLLVAIALYLTNKTTANEKVSVSKEIEDLTK
ncbi:MAG: YqhA family protein [Neptunomonas phycophila]